MSWTDERVDVLSRLWLEGKSASQIAGLLGGGLTRNAVIGKVHRLGLAGRVKAGAPTPKTAEGSTDVLDAAENMSSLVNVRRATPRAAVTMSSPPPAAPVARTMGANALSLASAPAPAMQPAPVSEENVVPLSLKVTIVELRENMCKWPIGDPSSMEFRYCGSPARPATPYCAHHGKVAYQPAQDRRRAAERDRRPLLAR
jgi:GcrA cell cycle regulator